jgi:hypothetical protein
MALVAAAIGMTILVLARNFAAHFGPGLMPVVLVGLVIAFVGLWYEIKGRSRAQSTVGVLPLQLYNLLS